MYSIFDYLCFDVINIITNNVDIVSRINFSTTCTDAVQYLNFHYQPMKLDYELSPKQLRAYNQLLHTFEYKNIVNFNAQMGFGKTFTALFTALNFLQSGAADVVFIQMKNQTLCSNWFSEAVKLGIADKTINSLTLSYYENKHKPLFKEEHHYILPSLIDDEQTGVKGRIILCTFGCRFSQYILRQIKLEDTEIAEFFNEHKVMRIVDEVHVLKDFQFYKSGKRVVLDADLILNISASIDPEICDVFIEKTYTNFSLIHSKRTVLFDPFY